jgi:hypothetical protein
MVKKLFALASISALTGLLATAGAAAGCSSTTSGGESDASTSPDTSKATPKDSGIVDDGAVAPTTCPTTTPLTAADIEAQLKWVPPHAVQSVCGQANLDDLKAAINASGTGGTKFTDIKAALGKGDGGAGCVACAFSKDTAPNWQPYVETTTGTISNRFASCLAQVESAACGKAFFQFDICIKVVCNDTDCADATAVTACQKKAVAVGGACNDLGKAYVAACPNGDAQLGTDGVCENSPKSIAASCGGGADAGLDGSL